VSKSKPAIHIKCKWLSGCAERDALLCFPCLLSGGDTTYLKPGGTDLKRLCEKVKKHENSSKHP